MTSNGRMWAGLGCGVAAGALWGLVFLAPQLVREFTPLQLAAARYLAYGLFAAALIAPRWRRLVRVLGPREWGALVWLSLLGNIVYYVLLASAVQLGGIAMTSLIIGFLPVAVTLIGSRDHGATPLARLAPSLLLGTAGILCIGWQSLGSIGSGLRHRRAGVMVDLCRPKRPLAGTRAPPVVAGLEPADRHRHRRSVALAAAAGAADRRTATTPANGCASPRLRPAWRCSPRSSAISAGTG